MASKEVSVDLPMERAAGHGGVPDEVAENTAAAPADRLIRLDTPQRVGADLRSSAERYMAEYAGGAGIAKGDQGEIVELRVPAIYSLMREADVALALNEHVVQCAV